MNRTKGMMVVLVCLLNLCTVNANKTAPNATLDPSTSGSGGSNTAAVPPCANAETNSTANASQVDGVTPVGRDSNNPQSNKQIQKRDPEERDIALLALIFLLGLAIGGLIAFLCSSNVMLIVHMHAARTCRHSKGECACDAEKPAQPTKSSTNLKNLRSFKISSVQLKKRKKTNRQRGQKSKSATPKEVSSDAEPAQPSTPSQSKKTERRPEKKKNKKAKVAGVPFFRSELCTTSESEPELPDLGVESNKVQEDSRWPFFRRSLSSSSLRRQPLDTDAGPLTPDPAASGRETTPMAASALSPSANTEQGISKEVPSKAKSLASRIQNTAPKRWPKLDWPKPDWPKLAKDEDDAGLRPLDLYDLNDGMPESRDDGGQPQQQENPFVHRTDSSPNKSPVPSQASDCIFAPPSMFSAVPSVPSIRKADPAEMDTFPTEQDTRAQNTFTMMQSTPAMNSPPIMDRTPAMQTPPVMQSTPAMHSPPGDGPMAPDPGEPSNQTPKKSRIKFHIPKRLKRMKQSTTKEHKPKGRSKKSRSTPKQ